MKKYDVITAVAEAFDRAEKAEAEVRRLFRITCEDACEVSYVNRFDRIALEIGKKHIVKDSLDYWKDVRVNRDDETEVVTVEPYGKWAKRVVKNIPDKFSKEDFFSYFEQELKDEYEKNKQEAIEEFNCEEGE